MVAAVVIRTVSGCVCALALAGCNHLRAPYPDYYVQWRQNIGMNPALLQQSPSKPTNRLLHAQEAGKIAALLGDPQASIEFYQQALTLYEAQEWTPLLSLSEWRDQTTAVATSDSVLPYQGSIEERILVHHQQSLNYLWLDQPQQALVELRRIDEMRRLSLTLNDELPITQFDSWQPHYEKLINKNINSRQHSVVSPYVLFSNAIIYQALGQYDDARIDLMIALSILPRSKLLNNQLTNLYCLIENDCTKIEKTSDFSNNKGNLVVLFEMGQVNARREFQLPLITNDFYSSVSFPYYSYINYGVMPDVSLNKKNVPFEIMADFNLIASDILEKQYKYIFSRALSRVLLKQYANKQAQRMDSTVTQLGLQIFTLLTEQADLRSWLSLPHQAAAWQAWMAPGEYQLQLLGIDKSLKVESGRTTMVWIAYNEGIVQIQVRLF